MQTVATYVQENLVSVTGIMDPTALYNQVASMGKEVKLISTDNFPNNNRHHAEEIHRDREPHHQHASQNYTRTRQKEKMHDNCCCQDGRHDHRKKKEEEVHKCEPYVPVKIDPRVCRSIYCKDHVKMQKITNNVNPENSTLFGAFPVYSEYGGSYANRVPYFYQRKHEEMQMPQFGYGRSASRMLPRPFGYRQGTYYP